MKENASLRRLRLTSLLSAALIFGLAMTCVTRAFAVQVTTTPNAALITLAVPAGAGSLSPALTLPVSNDSVLYSFASNTAAFRSSAFADITYHSAAPATVSWVGLHAGDSLGPDGTPGVSSGFRVVPAAGVDILQVAGSGGAALELAVAANQLRIENKNATAKSITVKAIW